MLSSLYPEGCGLGSRRSRLSRENPRFKSQLHNVLLCVSTLASLSVKWVPTAQVGFSGRD